MSQEARLEAFKKSLAAKRFGFGYAQDITWDEDDFTTRYLTSELSGAATNASTVAPDIDQTNMPITGNVCRVKIDAKRTFQGRAVGDLDVMAYMKASAEVWPDRYQSVTFDTLSRVFAATNPTSNQELITALWLGANDAGVFNKFDLFSNEPTDITQLITTRCESLTWRYAKQLSESLNHLLMAVKEENPQGPWIATESLTSFCDFIKANSSLTCPEIALTPDGNIYASWRADRRRLFSTQFMPNGDVRFVVFKPNVMHEDKVVRLSGSTTADALFNEIKNHGISSWILQTHER